MPRMRDAGVDRMLVNRRDFLARAQNLIGTPVTCRIEERSTATRITIDLGHHKSRLTAHASVNFRQPAPTPDQSSRQQSNSVSARIAAARISSSSCISASIDLQTTSSIKNDDAVAVLRASAIPLRAIVTGDTCVPSSLWTGTWILLLFLSRLIAAGRHVTRNQQWIAVLYVAEQAQLTRHGSRRR